MVCQFGTREEHSVLCFVAFLLYDLHRVSVMQSCRYLAHAE